MREVRVQSLREVGSSEDGIRLSVVAGHDEVSLVFPEDVWREAINASAQAGNHQYPISRNESALQDIEATQDIEDIEATEAAKTLEEIEDGLLAVARSEGYDTVLRGVASGRVEYGLVLRSSDLFSVTTGYVFAEEVREDTVSAVRDALSGGGSVEQVYIVGGTARAGAFDLADDDVRVLAVRGKQSSVSRFEMSPELWSVLSGGLRWADVEVNVPEETRKDIQSNPSKG